MGVLSMSTKWTTNGISGKEAPPSAAPRPMTESFGVLLLYGKNSFGDKIYSYLKITLPNLPRLKSAIMSGKGFTPSDFGEVIAAGKGEPTAEVRAEIAAKHTVMGNTNTSSSASNPPPAAVAAKPEEKKNWDEY